MSSHRLLPDVTVALAFTQGLTISDDVLPSELRDGSLAGEDASLAIRRPSGRRDPHYSLSFAENERRRSGWGGAERRSEQTWVPHDDISLDGWRERIRRLGHRWCSDE
jgi:hypothetical protein